MTMRTRSESRRTASYTGRRRLGFAAMENIFYNSSALLNGFDVFLMTALTRAVASTLLHASASAVLGYGIARAYINGARGRRTSYLPYYLAAVVLHGLFNAFAVAARGLGPRGDTDHRADIRHRVGDRHVPLDAPSAAGHGPGWD